jgi:hypothetical protein
MKSTLCGPQTKQLDKVALWKKKVLHYWANIHLPDAKALYMALLSEVHANT